MFKCFTSGLCEDKCTYLIKLGKLIALCPTILSCPQKPQEPKYYAQIKGTDKEGANNDKKQLEKWSVEPFFYYYTQIKTFSKISNQ